MSAVLPFAPPSMWRARPLAPRLRLPRAAPSKPQPAGGDARAAMAAPVAARAFNRIAIDKPAGRVVKWSEREAAKIGQEIAFYQQLPAAFAPLFPPLLDDGHSDGGRFYSMGYVPLPSLSQLFVDDTRTGGELQQALHTLLALQADFGAYQPAAMDAERLFGFYWDKTEQRLGQLPADGPLAGLLARNSITLNGCARLGWPRLRTAIAPLLARACAGAQGGFVHGDLCFSNVLWDEAAGRCRLIDPRGNFLGNVNWGDPRYDIAKLLHSAHGGYDFVIHDRFSVAPDGADGINLALHGSGAARTRETGGCLVDALRERLGPRALADGLLLEGLLFMSMVPLHYDAPARQLAFLAIGLELLNRCLEGRADAPLH